MLNPKKLKKSEAIKVIELYKEYTQATVAARIGPLGFPACGDFFLLAQQKEDELQEFIFGTSNIVQLGEMWGIIKEHKKKRKKKRKRK